MKNVVLFDLGNTLVHYYERSEFPGILENAITEAQNYLRKEGLLNLGADASRTPFCSSFFPKSLIAPESIWQRVEEENHEDKDHRVRPMEERLARIFQLGSSANCTEFMMAVCRHFMKPIFALAHRYEDVLSVLRELGSRGFRKAIISNTPWGCPADLWREEIERLDLGEQVDLAVFCRDVGWRKPARQIFDYTLGKLQVDAEDCIFVGDDPRWDLVGPRAVGIKAILIDRRGAMQNTEEAPINNLHELLGRLCCQRIRNVEQDKNARRTEIGDVQGSSPGEKGSYHKRLL